MDKTRVRGETYTGGERGQGGDICDSETRVVSRFSSEYQEITDLKEINSRYDYHTKGIHPKDMAMMDTLRNYFSDDWFDEGFYLRGHLIKSARYENDRLRGTSYQPMRCEKCKRPFQSTRFNRSVKFEYISKSLFANIPLIKGICGDCE